MTWKYSLAKKQEAGYTIYSVVEAFMNDDGSIWGVTSETDVLEGLQTDDLKSDDEAREHCMDVFKNVIGDLFGDVIDLDTFKFADPDFKGECEQLKRDLNEAS